MDNVKLSNALIRALESQKRVLLCNDEILFRYKKIFKYVREDERLISYSQDRTAMYSDCYILYAIAVMGVCTKDSISLFLRALAVKYPELAIVYEKSKDSMEGRLHNLTNLGYVFEYRYEIEAKGDCGDVKMQAVTLYTIVDAGFHIVRQRLQKKVAINTAIQYKPFEELVGWAAAAYVGASIAQSDGFTDYLERVLRTREVGSVFLPVEVKNVVNGIAYYIAVISSFLKKNSLIQTDNDYIEFCSFKLNVIKNYLAMRTQKGVAVVCIAVRDVDDLYEIGRLINKVPSLGQYIGQIFFTGEGIIKECGGNAKFLRLIADGNEEKGYRFEYIKPTFM